MLLHNLKLSLQVIDHVQALVLKLHESFVLLSIFLSNICFRVFRLLEYFLNAASHTFEFSHFVLLEVLVNFSVDLWLREPNIALLCDVIELRPIPSLPCGVLTLEVD